MGCTYTLVGTLVFRRSEKGKEVRKEFMRNGVDYTPFQEKAPYLLTTGIMNTLTGALTRDNLIVFEQSGKVMVEEIKRYDKYNKCLSDSDTAGTLKATGADPNLIIMEDKMAHGKVHRPDQVSQCLESGQSGGGGTSNRPMVIVNTKERTMNGLLQGFIKTKPEHSLPWLQVFRDRHTKLQIKEGDPISQEEMSLLRSKRFVRTKDPDVYYSDKVQAYYFTSLEKVHSLYLTFSPTLGMDLDSRYLILKSSDFIQNGKKCVLLDILEEDVDEKYFLSEKMIQGIFKSQFNERKPIQGDLCRTLKIGGDVPCLDSEEYQIGEW